MLTLEQRNQFLNKGYIVIKNAFPRDKATEWVRESCATQGWDLDDPATWTVKYGRVTTVHQPTMAEYAPAAWEAACELMGGEDRVKYCPPLDVLAMNFTQGIDQPYVPPAEIRGGWHKDGGHFVHFLDSYEQGLLGIPLLTDVLHRGGPTVASPDSIGAIARFLYDRPEGVPPYAFNENELIGECSEFIEIIGEIGDFYLIHPFMMHTVSQNMLGIPRAITNHAFELNEPMKFDRADSADYSLVELAILKALNLERLDFKPQGQRFRTKGFAPVKPEDLQAV